MAASIQLFALDLPSLGRTTGVRNLAGPELFKMTAANVVDWWIPSVDDALSLRVCVGSVRRRFRVAGERGEGVKFGKVFRRETAAGETVVELGVMDDEAIYFEFLGAPRIRLPNEDGDALLEALARFGDDVSNVTAAYGQGPAHLAASGPTRSILAGAHERLDQRIARDWYDR